MLFLAMLMNIIVVSKYGWFKVTELSLGYTPEIYALLNFEWLEGVYCLDSDGFTSSTNKLRH